MDPKSAVGGPKQISRTGGVCHPCHVFAYICENTCTSGIWIRSNRPAGQIGLNNENNFQCLRSNPLQFVGLVRGVGHLFA